MLQYTDMTTLMRRSLRRLCQTAVVALNRQTRCFARCIVKSLCPDQPRAANVWWANGTEAVIDLGLVLPYFIALPACEPSCNSTKTVTDRARRPLRRGDAVLVELDTAADAAPIIASRIFKISDGRRLQIMHNDKPLTVDAQRAFWLHMAQYQTIVDALARRTNSLCVPNVPEPKSHSKNDKDLTEGVCEAGERAEEGVELEVPVIDWDTLIIPSKTPATVPIGGNRTLFTR